MIEPTTHIFRGDGRFPNSDLPLLLYTAAVPADPAAIERLFAGHDWSNSWRNGVFSFHHFHSTAHEVLGLAAGEVRVAFGGPSGQELTLRAGDAVVIPAGVAHRNMGSTPDLLVVGAYPGGADCDIRRGVASEYPDVLRAIAAVPMPAADPVAGPEGWLPRLWQFAAGMP